MKCSRWRLKRRILVKIAVACATVAACVATGHPWLVLPVLGIGYVINELFFCDHIYYAPGSDYRFRFEGQQELDAFLSGHVSGYSLCFPTQVPAGATSLFAAVTVHCRWSGRWLDPHVRITGGGQQSVQYFERAASGQRYLNLSMFTGLLQAGSTQVLTIELRHCTLVAGSCRVLAFSHPDYLQKRTLVIAPHPDDAEIAGFGFYSQADSVHIVTLSAGDSREKRFEQVARAGTTAAVLKGRLREWESLFVSSWANIPREHCVNLGYFSNTFAAMHASPQQEIPSRSGCGSDVRIFREFNQRQLPSDNAGSNTGKNSWANLVQDLAALVAEIRPELIIAPHPQLDSHPDHVYATAAVQEACARACVSPLFLLYLVHPELTDMYPFGPAFSDITLPPHFDDRQCIGKPFALAVDSRRQCDKVMALGMMNDINKPQPFKKLLRAQLQRLIGRDQPPFHADDFFRKAVRNHEVFYGVDNPMLGHMLREHKTGP